MATAAAEKPARPKGLKLLAVALRNRRSATMLAFGFSSGLPFSLLVGTLTAWLGEVGVKLATIGIFSWIGLAYSFQQVESLTAAAHDVRLDAVITEERIVQCAIG